MDRRTRRREATTREKAVQVILGLLIYALFTAIALGVLVVLVKVHHLGA